MWKTLWKYLGFPNILQRIFFVKEKQKQIVTFQSKSLSERKTHTRHVWILSKNTKSTGFTNQMTAT